MKVYEGAVLTVDSNDSVAKFLVEDGGKIVFVGNELPEKYKNAEKVDLGSGCLIPAFVDTHQHFASFAVFNSGLNVMNAESNAEILEMSREYIKNNPELHLKGLRISMKDHIDQEWMENIPLYAIKL